MEVVQHVGIIPKEIDAQRPRHQQELLRVDGVFLEDLVHRSQVHVDALGQPTVGMALPPQLLTNDFANSDVRFLHGGLLLCIGCLSD